MTETTLFGFNGSTFVRTVRCVLARKSISYNQVPVNVLEGETQEPEHLERHPFGKVPVLDIDGMRLRETDAIVRYLEARDPEPPMFPKDAKERAKADENAALITNYGYDVVGGKNEEMRQSNLDQARKLIRLILENKKDAPFFSGDAPGFADYLLGPLIAYATMTEDGAAILSLDGMQDWWDRLSNDEAFVATAPDLG